MKRIITFLLVIMLVLTLCLWPLWAGADVGDFNDYGGGDWGGSDWGWSGSDGDWGGGGGNFSATSVGLFVIIIGVWVVLHFVKKSKGGSPPAASGAGPEVRDHTNAIVPAVQEKDPQFSNDKFIAWVKEVFFTLQYAWMERDWEKVRPFEKEELYKQHEMQLQQYINNGRINVLERININQAYLQKYVRDADYEYLSVFLQVRMTDYIKDEKTGAILKGSPDVDCHLKYIYTFMRKTGVLTDPASSNKSTTNCPNCGAPTKITSAGKCEYCESVITTGAFDWVLSNIDGVKPHTVIDDSGVIIRDRE
ncbi:MAG: Tim44-like domain-containing protein [Clostridiales bacterium]|nr:Tim44-like domain-containing protein [Clostridiales bacterium]